MKHNTEWILKLVSVKKKLEQKKNSGKKVTIDLDSFLTSVAQVYFDSAVDAKDALSDLIGEIRPQITDQDIKSFVASIDNAVSVEEMKELLG